MRKLLLFVCGFAAAVAVLIYFLEGVFWSALPVCAGAALLLFLVKKPLCRRLSVICLGLALGAAWCSGYTTLSLRPIDDIVGESVTFRARAVEYSADTKYGHRVTADLLLEGRKLRTNLYYTEEISLQPGDILSGTAELERAAMGFAEGEDLYDISRGVLLTGGAKDLAVCLAALRLHFGSFACRFFSSPAFLSTGNMTRRRLWRRHCSCCFWL